MKRSLAIAAMVLSAVAVGRAQIPGDFIAVPAVDDEAVAAMDRFLTAWTVGDRQGAMDYFSYTNTALGLAPDDALPVYLPPVVTGLLRGDDLVLDRLRATMRRNYWGMLNILWTPDMQGGPLPNRAEAFIRGEIGAEPYSGRYLAFVADDPVEVNSFDVIAGRVWTTLSPASIVVMVADFQDRSDVGPFVAFWTETAEGWRIQSLGAYPIY